MKPRRDIIIRGVDGQPLAVQGTGEVWIRDPLATFWKKVKLVVTVEGSWTLISPKDQKRLLLLQRDYPRFLGVGRYRRYNKKTPQTKATESDSGLSGSNSDSDSEEEDKSEDSIKKDNYVNSVGSDCVNGSFSGPLPWDEVQVRYDGESIEIELGEGISEEHAIAEACSDAFCNTFGSHYARELLGEEGLAALLVDTSKQGKPDDDDDYDPDSTSVGPNVDEEELIAQKTEFERKFILEFRSLFSETLSRNQYL